MDAQWAEWEAEGRMPAGLRTAVLHAAFPDVLTHLMQRFSLTGVHSYAESGLRHTYARDIRVRDLLDRVPMCRGMSTNATEFSVAAATDTVGANSGLRTCHNLRNTPTSPWPSPRPPWPWSGRIQWRAIPIPTGGPAGFQPGGERRAHAYLESFVTDRIRRYARAISKPAEQPRGVQPIERVSGLGQLEHPSGAPASSGCPQRRRRCACRAAAQLSAFDSRLALALSFHPESLRWKTGWSLTM